MIALLAALLLTGGADSLTTVKVGAVSMKAPASWPTETEGDGQTAGKIWKAPEGDGELGLSVFPVDPPKDAKECLDELLQRDAQKGKSWDKLTFGGAPAVRNVTTDYVGDGPDAGKIEANKVTTVTYIGCNGAAKWVLTMTSKASKSARFGPLLKTITGSIAYAK